MTSNLETWERKDFVIGGGDPFLFYVIYGQIDLSAPLSRRSYRSNGIPDGLDVMSYGPNEHAEVPGSFREGHLWDQFVRQNPNAYQKIAECNRCLVVRGTPTDPSNLNYLRDTIGFITYMLDNGGIGVYDPIMFRWWASEDWKKRLFDVSSPTPQNHVLILVSEEDDPSLKWFHTRGMRKFGRPDISVHNVTKSMEGGVTELCNRLIELQASGQVIRDRQEVRMASLPPLGTITHAGDFDDPDFNNVHLEVFWPAANV